MAFNFCKDHPTTAIIQDIQSLDKFNAEQYEKLVPLGLDLLLHPSKSSTIQSELEEFGTTNSLNVSALRNVFKSFLLVLNGAVRKTLTPSQIKDDFIKLGLSNEKAEFLANQWRDNSVSLSRSALSQTLMVNQLVDMEWKFGVTASSSDLNTVGNTFLQLKLVINKGNKIENVYMELTLPQFYSFLHEMEKAKASLEYVS